MNIFGSENVCSSVNSEYCGLNLMIMLFFHGHICNTTWFEVKVFIVFTSTMLIVFLADMNILRTCWD